MTKPADPKVSPETHPAVINTYRYLRVGMILLVFLLAVAILLQVGKLGCWQTSISAYYFTPVHAIFIATLCALGVCLIVYQGSSDTEDALLNFAGFLAFIVATVPTKRPGGPVCGADYLPGSFDATLGIRNNVLAILAIAAIAEVARLVVRYYAKPRQPVTRPAKIAMAFGYVLIAVGTVVFVRYPDGFTVKAHLPAAGTMFVFILIVAIVSGNSAGKRAGGRKFLLAYQGVTAFMALSVVAVLVMVARGWEHTVLWAEIFGLAAFAAFWIIQTIELWKYVTREQKALAAPD